MITLTYLFIIDFDVTDSDFNKLIKFLAGFMVNLLDCSWNDSALLEVIRQPQHRVGLATASLTVAHDRSIISFNYTLDYLLSRRIINIILSSIMKDLRKFELPSIAAVVDNALVFLFDENFKFL